MRPFVLPILAVLLAGPASRADDAAKPAASSSDEIASFALKGFDLASIKTFDFAPDAGSCLVELTMSLGPLGILAVNEDDEPDVLADCRTAELPGGPQGGGTTLSVTAVTLSDPGRISSSGGVSTPVPRRRRPSSCSAWSTGYDPTGRRRRNKTQVGADVRGRSCAACAPCPPAWSRTSARWLDVVRREDPGAVSGMSPNPC